MQLTISALGKRPTHFIVEILAAVSSCKCNVLDLSSSNLAQSTAAYILVDGNWNHIAKLESLLDSLQKRLEIQLHTIRPEPVNKLPEGIPYSLETISLDHTDILMDITNFLFERKICIEEIKGSSYKAPYIQTPIFSSKFIILIPSDIRLLSLREEFLDFCDNLNIDAIIEPIKR